MRRLVYPSFKSVKLIDKPEPIHTQDEMLQVVMHQLVNRNTAPSDEIVDEIRDFRRRTTVEIEELVDERVFLQKSIIEMCGRLAKVQCRMAKKRQELTTCKQILSPIRMLPPEILGEIFRAFVEDREDDKESNRHPAMTPSQVCSSWRQAALGMGSLWQIVSANHKPSTAFHRVSHDLLSISLSHILDTYFQRSDRLPLSFTLKSLTQISGAEPMHPLLLRSIMQQTHRIQSLELHAGLKSVLEPVLQLPGDAFPILQRLLLNVTDFKAWSSPIIAFASAPLLRHVTLALRPHHPFQVSLPWSQITYLNMISSKKPMDDGTWRVLIRLLLNLEEGRFFISQREGQHPDPLRNHHPQVDLETPCSLQRLKLLAIHFQGQESELDSWLLRNLKIPNLLHFQFYTIPYPYFYRWNELTLTNLAPALGGIMSLTISAVLLTPQELIDILEQMPSLRTFKFNPTPSWQMTPHSVQYLLTTLEDPDERELTPLLPSLDSLTLCVHDLAGSLPQGYARMILARVRRRETFRISLYIDKRRTDIIQSLPALLSACGPKEIAKRFIDVKLIEPDKLAFHSPTVFDA